jgi:hypothetical protein
LIDESRRQSDTYGRNIRTLHRGPKGQHCDGTVDARGGVKVGDPGSCWPPWRQRSSSVAAPAPPAAAPRATLGPAARGWAEPTPPAAALAVRTPVSRQTPAPGPASRCGSARFSAPATLVSAPARNTAAPPPRQPSRPSTTAPGRPRWAAALKPAIPTTAIASVSHSVWKIHPAPPRSILASVPSTTRCAMSAITEIM